MPKKKKNNDSKVLVKIKTQSEKKNPMDWEPNINQKGLRKLAEDYNSMDLLESVDSLDAIRYLTADRGINTPPQLRFDLMELHSLVFRLLRQSHELSREEKEKLFDLVESTEHDVYTILENAKKILKTLRPLSKLFSDSDNSKDEDDASGSEDEAFF